MMLLGSNAPRSPAITAPTVWLWILLCCPALAWANPVARFITNYGSFEVELFESRAPVTVANFVARIHEGFFRDTLFHRLVPGVSLHGGAYSSQWMAKASAPPLPNEGDNGISNWKWTLAMSSAGDNASSATEFFINLGDNDDFDFGPANSARFTCVFGEVSDGHDTLRKIIAAGVMSGGDFVGDRPTQEILLFDVKLLTDN